MAEDKAPRKDNNFGALRLLFASVVILAHSPEILDGNRNRELLNNIFGTLSFGVLGVAGFFIISGYLITKSFLSSPTMLDYLKRRVLRIYPAFIACFLLCLIVVAPLGGVGLSTLHPAALVRNLGRMVILLHPNADGVFPGLPVAALNGSMWTIPYEFHCYLLVMAFGAAGLFKGSLRYLILAVVLAALVASGFVESHSSYGLAATLFGTLEQNLQLLPLFGAGALFALFERDIVYRHAFAAIAAVALVILLFFSPAVPFALAIFGGYLIFWFAFHCPVLPISRFTNKTDLSYGIYLYAWPIQSMIAFHTARAINPWALSVFSLALAAAAAWVSWTFLEKPALALAHRRTTGLQQPQLTPTRQKEGAA